MLEIAGIELLPAWPVFLGFVAAGLALNIVPGADMTFVIAAAVRGGRRDGAVAALGIGAAFVIVGPRVTHLVRYIRDPVVLAFSTASSEAAYPRTLEALDRFGVPRASLVVIAATLSMFNIPEAGLLLILAVDHFLDMGRSATNVVGNAVASAVIARWEGKLDPVEPVDVEPPHAPSGGGPVRDEDSFERV